METVLFLHVINVSWRKVLGVYLTILGDWWYVLRSLRRSCKVKQNLSESQIPFNSQTNNHHHHHVRLPPPLFRYNIVYIGVMWVWWGRGGLTRLVWTVTIQNAVMSHQSKAITWPPTRNSCFRRHRPRIRFPLSSHRRLLDSSSHPVHSTRCLSLDVNKGFLRYQFQTLAVSDALEMLLRIFYEYA